MWKVTLYNDSTATCNTYIVIDCIEHNWKTLNILYQIINFLTGNNSHINLIYIVRVCLVGYIVYEKDE